MSKLKTGLLSLFAAALFFCISGCSYMSVHIESEAPYLLNKSSKTNKKYTIIADKQSAAYLQIMNNLPYFIYALHLQGYEFAGFNNYNASETEFSIVIGLTYLENTHWSSVWSSTETFGRVTTNKIVKSARTIIDAKTKEIIWQTELIGRDRDIINLNKKLSKRENQIINTELDIPVILHLGGKFIASNGRYISTGPEPLTDIDEYIDFIYDSIEYYNAKEKKEFPVPQWAAFLKEHFSW
jgi:hypothetical protein